MIQIIYMNCGYRTEVKVILAVVKQLKAVAKRAQKKI